MQNSVRCAFCALSHLRRIDLESCWHTAIGAGRQCHVTYCQWDDTLGHTQLSLEQRCCLCIIDMALHMQLKPLRHRRCCRPRRVLQTVRSIHEWWWSSNHDYYKVIHFLTPHFEDHWRVNLSRNMHMYSAKSQLEASQSALYNQRKNQLSPQSRQGARETSSRSTLQRAVICPEQLGSEGSTKNMESEREREWGLGGSRVS